MEFNWALFTSEYDDQQVSTFQGTGFVVANAAVSEVDGVEFDWRWQATDSLRISANLAILDATYGSFPGGACTAEQASDIAGGAASSGACAVQAGSFGIAQDLTGASLANAPDYSGSISFQYEAPISTNWRFFVGADFNFTDGYFLAADIDPLDFQDSFEKIDVRFGFNSDNWEVLFFGKNITDEISASGGFDTPLLSGGHSIYTDPGEVYGAKVTYRF